MSIREVVHETFVLRSSYNSCAVSLGQLRRHFTKRSGTPPPASYTISGRVTGLAGSGGLVLQNNGANDLSVRANGAFQFSTTVTSGGAYNVTVLTQPSNPVEQCTITNGKGKANANVTNVQVECAQNSPTPPAQYTISGTVTGLAAGSGGLILEDNGANNLSVKANGRFSSLLLSPVAGRTT